MHPEIENRLHPRLPISSPAIMITATGVMEGELENISLSGAFIRCQTPLDSGQRLIVTAKLPYNPSFNSQAEVVWSRVPGPNEQETIPGMGVKFIDLT